MKRRQLGFIYLTTGANGAGKTLLTLKEVHEKSLKESRPVAYNGRFDMVEDGPLANWKKIDAKDWQLEPDGTIFVFDECQHDFPNRGRGEPPPYVSMITEHRKRGFDFFMITQHPMNMDVFIRRLIGSPGYHRHLKRPMGGSLVSQLEWPAVNANCEKDGAGKTAETKLVPFPKEVFTWYRSSNLHTGKLRIPKAVWITLVCVLAVPVLGYLTAKVLMKPRDIAAKVLGDKAAAQAATASPATGSVTGSAAPKVLTASEYALARTPRIEGLAYTAPAFDSVTQPVVAPYPAACLDGFNRRTQLQDCKCYTQQGTSLPVPMAVCKQIAHEGFFIEWAQDKRQGAQEAPKPSMAAPAGPAAVSPALVAASGSRMPVALVSSIAQPDPVESSDGSTIRAMRNGQRRW